MKSRARILGHPIHPMVMIFPAGLLLTATIFDIIALITGNPIFSMLGFWNITAGIIGGLIAATPGVIDWMAIPEGTRAKAIGLWHGGGNVLNIVLFAVVWFLRLGMPGNSPAGLPIVLQIIGIALLGVTGWLGGELVDRHGVGVDPGANLNSPNSLSGKPADANQSGTERLQEREAVG
ncbi:MAG: DUF2231 domain-containing protein [Chloroflexaceae bacterium]